MPYDSKAQAAYLHSQKPEVAAKFDRHTKKGSIKKLPQHVSKAKTDWMKTLAVGTVAGGLANQFPRVQDIERDRKRKTRKKAKITKMLVPVHDDPYFNQAAAQKVFDLVMKMDDETAEMFVHVVASDLLEREVEENRVTLQKHLDEVIEQRYSQLNQVLAKRALAGEDEALAYAEALARFEEFGKASPADETPNWEFERKIKRDAASGRFQTKFSDRGLDKPLPDKTAKALGIANTTGPSYKALSDKDKARYQNQYLQIRDYLNAVNAATGGEHETLIHYRDDATGETWADTAVSTKPPTTMLPANVRAIGAESRPATLTAGGTAFSLAGAMGHTMGPESVGRINAGAAGAEGWTKTWLEAGDTQNQNARLYQRTKTLGEVAGTVGPPGGKVQLAGAMAEIVGQYGPQAESVLGPSARKTAYRYRGTERAPDERLVEMYGNAVAENKRTGPIDPWAEQQENRIRRARGAGRQPFGSQTGVRGKGTSRRTPKPSGTPSLTQMVAERESRAGRAPEWQEREMGRVAVSRYLMDQLPSKQNYKLQLASGNTPPSEGVIINAEGQIVSQAVGYGDDHYLPFNLKHLKGLKGGEYIRNRSVGGLTAEDVYTGLISGARRVTVVSRSGTFTMEFKEDFRGGRRHNDKARRMTRRYEQILDAVQSEQVERQNVPARWRKMIEDEVRGEYGTTASPRLVRAEIDARIKEFKANPQIDGRDLDRAEAEISRMEEREKRGEVGRQDVADYRKQVMGELRDLKEIHFRLNGVGYAAALDSLREQFPYYIEAQSRPTEEDLESGTSPHEKDSGYVEPGRNRPTEAKAGLFGTRREESGKYSAAYADYQRGRPGSPEPHGHPREKGKFVATNVSSDTGSSGGGGVRSERERARDKAAEALQAGQSEERVKTAAVSLQQAAKAHRPPGNSPTPEWWDLDENQMREWVDKKENLDKFHTQVSAIGDKWDDTDASRQWQAYRNARNRSGTGVAYGPEHAGTWQTNPYKFPNDERDAYRPSPVTGSVEAEIRRLDGNDIGLKSGKPLSALTEKELREEFDLSKNVRNAMKAANLQGDAAQDALGSQFGGGGSAFAGRFFRDDKGAVEHLENIHRMRHLKTKTNWGGGGGPAPGPRPGPGFSGAPGGTPTPPVSEGGGGRLVPVDEAEIERVRANWVRAAEKVQGSTSDQSEFDALGVFIGGMNASRGHERGFKRHDDWLDDLDPELRKKVEGNLIGASR